MVILIKAAQLILSLSILVILHEFGHFIFAKAFKCRVEKFFLFFDPWFSLFRFKKGETEYGVGWLPLGGYVKIAGMIDESMDKEQMNQPVQPWEFRAKPAWQRLLIMIGGVLFNLIFALVLYSAILFTWGEEYLPNKNVKYGIVASEVGKEVGFQTGDKILTIDGEPVEKFSEIIPTIVLEGAQSVQVMRNNQEVDVDISTEDIAKLLKSKVVIAPRFPAQFKVGSFSKESPARDAGMELNDKFITVNGEKFEYYDQFSSKVESLKGQLAKVTVLRDGATKEIEIKVSDEGKLGFFPEFTFGKDIFQYETITYGFFESFPAGVAKSVSTVQDYLKQFKLMFSPETKAYESLGGFIAIGNIFPDAWDWYRFWNLTAFLSIVLAVMNILPIPALDGGHVLFLLYEIISGRKPSDKFMEYAQITGMVILLGLLVLANGNDIIKLLR